MPRKSPLASVAIDVGVKTQSVGVREPDEPFRILVAGNFSGGAGRNRRPMGIDRDNFDQVMSLLAPEIRVQVAGGSMAISFRSLDDFHPESLFARLEPFEALRGLRQRLSNPATFQKAASQIAPAAAEKPDPELANLSGAELLRRMTGEAPPPRAAAAKVSDWDQMLRQITAPYAVPKEDPRQRELIARTDAAIEGEMRALLHRQDFQALEAAWRGLHFLVRRIETGENLKIYLMDLPHDEIVGSGLGDLARALQTESWSVIAGLYYFGAEEEETLSRIAALAEDANAPFLAGLAPEVVGLDAVFKNLRTTLKARWLGLALPRFLLRLPYGKETSETESFAFEEMPTPPKHEWYLWGHPAIACAYLLAAAFERAGWQMTPGSVREIEGLPAHVYRVDGEAEVKPCAEVLLTDDAAEVLLDRGFMPLASVKGTDRVRLVRFQSIGGTVLGGKWSS